MNAKILGGLDNMGAICIGGPLDGQMRPREGHRIEIPVLPSLVAPISDPLPSTPVTATKIERVVYHAWFHRWPGDRVVFAYVAEGTSEAEIWKRLFEIGMELTL